MNGLRTRLTLDQTTQQTHDEIMRPIDRVIAWIGCVGFPAMVIWQIAEKVMG